MDLRRKLQARLQDLEHSPDPEAIDRLVLHAQQISRWNPSAKLVSRGDLTGPGLLRHYVESLRALPYLGNSRLLLDIGSGAGFPGLVWVACRPGMAAILVESSRRKAAFLRHAAHAMGLPEVRVLGRHLADPASVAEQGADLLTTRAAAAGELVLEAGRQSASGQVRAVIYAGREDAGGLVQADGFDLVARIDLLPEASTSAATAPEESVPGRPPDAGGEGAGQLLVLHRSPV